MNNGCDVSLGDYDGETATLYHEAIVVARKTHRCDECDEAIPLGSRYERIKGCWGGNWRTYRFCLPCSEIQRAFCEHNRTFGILWETLHNGWRDGAHLQACLNRVTTVAAKTKMQQYWRRWKRL